MINQCNDVGWTLFGGPQVKHYETVRSIKVASVHVTKQVARIVDAEPPPSNRHRDAVQSSRNGRAYQQSWEHNNTIHLFINGSGRDNGSSKNTPREQLDQWLQNAQPRRRWKCVTCLK